MSDLKIPIFLLPSGPWKLQKLKKPRIWCFYVYYRHKQSAKVKICKNVFLTKFAEINFVNVKWTKLVFFVYCIYIYYPSKLGKTTKNTQKNCSIIALKSECKQATWVSDPKEYFVGNQDKQNKIGVSKQRNVMSAALFLAKSSNIILHQITIKALKKSS